MNLKERIIRAKVSRLDPFKDAAQIQRLKAQVRTAAACPVQEAQPGPVLPPPERISFDQLGLSPEEMKMVDLTCELFDGKVVEVLKNVPA